MSRTYDKDTIKSVLDNDLARVWEKDVQYARSWMKRGGVSAFMMLARKWDRIEEQVKKFLVIPGTTALEPGAYPYDIFSHIAADRRPEGIIDDIRDLRRYLALVEAEMLARGVVKFDTSYNAPAAAPAEVKTLGITSDTADDHGDTTGQGHPFGYHAADDAVDPPADRLVPRRPGPHEPAVPPGRRMVG